MSQELQASREPRVQFRIPDGKFKIAIALLQKLKFSASSAQPELLDPLARPAQLALLARTAHLVSPVTEADKDHPDPLDHLARLARPEIPDHQDNPDSLEKMDNNRLVF